MPHTDLNSCTHILTSVGQRLACIFLSLNSKQNNIDLGRGRGRRWLRGREPVYGMRGVPLRFPVQTRGSPRVSAEESLSKTLNP